MRVEMKISILLRQHLSKLVSPLDILATAMTRVYMLLLECSDSGSFSSTVIYSEPGTVVCFPLTTAELDNMCMHITTRMEEIKDRDVKEPVMQMQHFCDMSIKSSSEVG